MDKAGILIENAEGLFLICHVTGQDHWSIPKGEIESGETEFQCAIRETKEETGIDFSGSSQVFDHIARRPYNSSGRLTLFHTKIKHIPAESLFCDSTFECDGCDLPEMDDYKWATKEEVLNLVNPRLSLYLEKVITE